MGNQTSDSILEWINEVLDDLVRTYKIKDTYIDKENPWFGLLAGAAFTIFLQKIGEEVIVWENYYLDVI